MDRLVEHLTIRRLARSRWAADGRPVFLLLTHRAGGGTERHVRELAGSFGMKAFGPCSSARAQLQPAAYSGKNATTADASPGAAKRIRSPVRWNRCSTCYTPPMLMCTR